MQKSVFSLFILGIFFALAARGQAQLPPGDDLKTYVAHVIDIDAQFRYFPTNSNFSKSGNNADSLPLGGSFTTDQFDLGARALVGRRWAVFGSTTFGYSQSSYNGENRTNGGLSEATVGTDLLLLEGDISLAPELSLTYPFTKNDYGSNTAAIGEGVTSANARLIALINSSHFRFGAYGGVTYREQGLSTLLPYGTLIEMAFGNARLGADLVGYTSLTYDKDSDNDSQRQTFFCQADGCSETYGALNPGLLKTDLYLHLALNRTLDFYASLGDTLTGQSSARGFSATAGFTYRWVTAAKHLTSPHSRVIAPTFKEEVNDGVDQTLFAPQSYPAPEQDPNAPRRRQKTKMQNDLEKTEMQIQLKSNKNKKPNNSEE